MIGVCNPPGAYADQKQLEGCFAALRMTFRSNRDLRHDILREIISNDFAFFSILVLVILSDLLSQPEKKTLDNEVNYDILDKD